MSHPEAPPTPDRTSDWARDGVEGRREPNLRIVHSNDTIVASPRPAQALPSWVEVARQQRNAPAERPDPMLDRNLQARIGGMLREVFSDLADAPVPDRFAMLLEALNAKEDTRE